jgi:nicotinamidase-related amidase
MTFPAFYQPERVGQLDWPDVNGAVQAGVNAGLSAAAADTWRVLLLLVDAQIDFIHPEGSLCVPGAVDDTRRTIEWLLRHAGQVTAVAASLDSHIPIQIFFPTWWADASGQHPAAFTVITSADVQAGRWQPLYEPDWSTDYVRRLESQAKKALMIWPYHTLIGTQGHNLMPALYEALAYHTAARQAQPILLTKGSIPKTEHYSILEPEVKVPEQPQGQLNTDFIHILESYDRVYIAGQAKSHCVLETVTSLMNYFRGQPERIGRLRLLIDCTSSVAHPEIDFEALANETYARYAQEGLRLVQSTDPLD